MAYKAVAANVSDVGAMGGTPLYFLISFAAPIRSRAFHGSIRSWTVSPGHVPISTSLCLEATRHRRIRIFVDVSMIGTVPSGKAIGRFGAKEGDFVYVTGRLGSSSSRIGTSENREPPAMPSSGTFIPKLATKSERRFATRLTQ